jgi:hypothetical protein
MDEAQGIYGTNQQKRLAVELFDKKAGSRPAFFG